MSQKVLGRQSPVYFLISPTGLRILILVEHGGLSKRALEDEVVRLGLSVETGIQTLLGNYVRRGLLRRVGGRYFLADIGRVRLNAYRLALYGEIALSYAS